MRLRCVRHGGMRGGRAQPAQLTARNGCCLHLLVNICVGHNKRASSVAALQGYPLGVVPALENPPAKKPAAEIDVPGGWRCA